MSDTDPRYSYLDRMDGLGKPINHARLKARRRAHRRWWGKFLLSVILCYLVIGAGIVTMLIIF